MVIYQFEPFTKKSKQCLTYHVKFRLAQKKWNWFQDWNHILVLIDHYQWRLQTKKPTLIRLSVSNCLGYAYRQDSKEGCAGLNSLFFFFFPPFHLFSILVISTLPTKHEWSEVSLISNGTVKWCKEFGQITKLLGSTHWKCPNYHIYILKSTCRDKKKLKLRWNL